MVYGKFEHNRMIEMLENGEMIQKKQNDLNGIQLAGNNSMAEVLLWALILLPPVIAVNGAGVCFIHIGLFAGITFACLFLVKRLRSYRDISGKEIFNMGDFLYARYSSYIIKEIFMAVWLFLVGMITTALLSCIGIYLSSAIGHRMTVVACAISLLCVLSVCFVSRKIRNIVRNIVYTLMVVLFLVLVIWLFVVNTPAEILDTYGKVHLPGGTSTYLNILYYDGKSIGVTHIISMLGMGLGCLGLPFLFHGAIEAKNVRSLDRGRVLSIIYTGVSVVILSIWSLLNVVSMYPLKAREDIEMGKLLDIYITSLCYKEKYPLFFRYLAGGLFLCAVICLLERVYAMMFELLFGMVGYEKKIRSKALLTGIDLSVVLLLTGVVTGFAVILHQNYRQILYIAWDYSAAIAAVCILPILWRGASKAGIVSGFFTGIVVCTIWRFPPFIENQSLANATELGSGVAAFIISLAVTVIVSMFTHKEDKTEKKLFEQIKLEQR